MAYVLLAVAIVSEVTATVALRMAEGFTRPVPSVVVGVGYVVSFVALSYALKWGLPLGLAYGIWSAVGTAAVAGLGVALFGEHLTGVQIGGIALVVGGVLALELGKAP